MKKRKNRTIAQAEAERPERRQREADALKELAREEQEAAQERDLEEAQEIVEQHKQNKPAPPRRDKYGNLVEPAAEDEPAGPNAAWQAYDGAMVEYEERRRRMAAMGLTMRQAPPQPPKEGRDELAEAERQRRAQLGIPAKPKGYGRPPWA